MRGIRGRYNRYKGIILYEVLLLIPGRRRTYNIMRGNIISMFAIMRGGALSRNGLPHIMLEGVEGLKE